MIIKVRKLTWAPVTSGGEGSAMVYTGGKVDSDKVVRVEQNEERNNSGFNADDHRIDRDNSINSATVNIELAKLTDELKQKALGYDVASGSTDMHVTDEAAPFLGVGFIHGDLYKGVESYTATWYHKVQFSRGSRNFNTKGDTVAYQTETINGEAMGVQLTEDGKTEFFVESGELATEAAALAWLKTKAGIS